MDYLENKTAEGMWTYFSKNRFGPNWSQNKGLNLFEVIEKALTSDEEVFMTFIGQHNCMTITKHDGYYAYAITNKRLIMGQAAKIAGEDKLQTVDLSSITDVAYEPSRVFAFLRINTTDGLIQIGIDKQTGDKTFAKIRDTINELKR